MNEGKHFIIDRDEEPEPYEILESLLEHHDGLEAAKIVIAWKHKVNADDDGVVMLGKMTKLDEVTQRLTGYDFRMDLNADVWQELTDGDASLRIKRAIIDHELCHARPKLKDDEQVVDATGRRTWRTRKHVIEEFPEVVQRHGLWNGSLQALAKAAKVSASLFVEKPDLNDLARRLVERTGSAEEALRVVEALNGGAEAH